MLGAVLIAAGACAKDDDLVAPIPYAEVPGSYALAGTLTQGRSGTVRGSIVIESIDIWGQFPCTAELAIEEGGSPTLTVTAPCDGAVLTASELTFRLRPGDRPLSWRFFGGERDGTAGFAGGEHVGEEAGTSWQGTWRLTRLSDEAQ